MYYDSCNLASKEGDRCSQTQLRTRQNDQREYSIFVFWFLLVIGKIKTNMNRGPTFRFVNAIEYITVGYSNEIKKQRIKEHSNEVGCSNLLVYPTVTRKLRHVATIERGLVNPYQKPQRLMMRLIEMFSNEGDWILDLFSGTSINLKHCAYSNIFEHIRLANTTFLSQTLQVLHPHVL